MAKITEIGSEPLPFLPLMQKEDGSWLWWCPMLDHRSGRCTIYATRPNNPCATYPPREDALCVEHCYQFQAKNSWV